MGLTLTVLGCSGSYPGPGEACSGYLIRGAGATIWLDAGSGTMANLQLYVGLDEVDAIVLSHDHADHWSDLEGFFVATAYVRPRPAASVPVYAPEPVRRAAGFAEHPDSPLRWHVVGEGSEVEVSGVRLRFSRTEHTTETLAVRVDGDGSSLGYSADTGPGWSLAALGPPLDLALCEATYLTPEEGTYLHMSARQAGTTAREAGARRLVLTHLWPVVDPADARDEAEAAFRRGVEVARTNRSYEL